MVFIFQIYFLLIQKNFAIQIKSLWKIKIFPLMRSSKFCGTSWCDAFLHEMRLNCILVYFFIGCLRLVYFRKGTKVPYRCITVEAAWCDHFWAASNWSHWPTDNYSHIPKKDILVDEGLFWTWVNFKTLTKWYHYQWSHWAAYTE